MWVWYVGHMCFCVCYGVVCCGLSWYARMCVCIQFICTKFCLHACIYIHLYVNVCMYVCLGIANTKTGLPNTVGR